MTPAVPWPAALVAVAVVLAGGRLRPNPPERRPNDPAPDRPRRWCPARLGPAVRRPPVAAVVALVAVAALVVGLLPVGVIVAFTAAAPPARRELTRRRAVDGARRALPDGIDLLVLLVHAGLTPRAAVGSMAHIAPAPLRPPFAEVARRLERGEPLAAAVTALPSLIGPTAGPVADHLAEVAGSGGPIGPALTALADEARLRRRLLAEADARRLPVRLSFPLVVCTLPAFVLLAIAPVVIAALSSFAPPAW